MYKDSPTYKKFLSSLDKNLLISASISRLIARPQIEGFEYFYAKKVTTHFKKKAKAPTPDVLFTWWVKKGIYREGDEWTKLIEAVAKEKKKLETKQPDAFYNRLESRTKTAEEFRAWYARVQESKK